MNYAFASISELQHALKAKKISPAELLDIYIARFAIHDPQLNCALEIFERETVLEASNEHGPLYGIPGLIKDNIVQQDRALSCGSHILQGFTATYDATASTRLKQSGAALLGRANMDEFAMGSSGETSAFGPAKNPWDHSRVPGGSSSGSIAAVAAGLVPWALGSETGGSVRQPAAFCGIVGLKPTYGLISRYGLVNYTSSLDQIGIATRNVKDNATILSVIAGNDHRDSSSLPVKQHDYTQELTGKIKPGLRIGVVENALNVQGIDPEISQAIEQAITTMQKLGATIERVKLPTMDYSAAVYFIVSRAEAASNLARFDGVRYGLRAEPVKTLQEMYFKTRHDGFGAEVRSRIMIGNYVLSVGHADAYYKNAKAVQRMMRQEFMDTFKKVDALIMPTHPIPAFKFGAFNVDKLQMDLQDYFTCAANLTGVPALAVPCGFTKDNLPIGFQFVGPHLSEALLYQTAHAYEQATEWHTKHPKGYE